MTYKGRVFQLIFDVVKKITEHKRWCQFAEGGDHAYGNKQANDGIKDRVSNNTEKGKNTREKIKQLK